MPAPYKLIMIESRTQSDKDNGCTEQEVFGSVLQQLGVMTKIIEVDTPSQFFRALRRAESEHVRYVHFSGHGESEGVVIGDAFVSWDEIDANCWPNLRQVCLTFSSCYVARGVQRIFHKHKTFCSAVVAATREVTWPESAVAFAAFYLRATMDDTSTEQDVRMMNHICGPGTFKCFRASVANATVVLG